MNGRVWLTRLTAKLTSSLASCPLSRTSRLCRNSSHDWIRRQLKLLMRFLRARRDCDRSCRSSPTFSRWNGLFVCRLCVSFTALWCCHLANWHRMSLSIYASVIVLMITNSRSCSVSHFYNVTITFTTLRYCSCCVKFVAFVASAGLLCLSFENQFNLVEPGQSVQMFPISRKMVVECMSVSDAELLMRLIKDVDIASQLLNLIDEMLQRPTVTQVCSLHLLLNVFYMMQSSWCVLTL